MVVKDLRKSAKYWVSVTVKVLLSLHLYKYLLYTCIYLYIHKYNLQFGS